MPDIMQIKRGLKAELPEAALDGELLFCTDTKELYVGANGTVEPVKIELDTSITSDIPVPYDIGGIKKGRTFDKALISDVLLELIYPYTSPSVTLTTNQASLIEAGIRLANTACTIKILKRMYDVRSVNLYKAGKLLQSWGNVSTNYLTPVTLIYSDTATLTTDTTYLVEVTDDKQTVSESVTIDFELPTFIGICDNIMPSETEINSASRSIKRKASLAQIFTTKNQRMMFVYPYEWGALQTIKDINQFDITNTFTKQVITHSTLAGANKYYAYVSNITTVTNFKVAFNF